MINLKFKIKNLKLIESRGFTLIELLVVISIIAILTSFLTVNLIGVRQRTRDAQRKSDLRQIQSALEQYRSDSGQYPVSLPACGNSLSSGSIIYMQKILCDPLLKAVGYGYVSQGNPPMSYKLTACLENTNDQDKDQPTDPSCTQPPFSLQASFTVNNP